MQESAIDSLSTLLSAQADAVASQLTQRASALGRRCDKRNVHALRVASRRARALLWSMKPWVAPGLYKATVKRVKSVASLLGPMRNIDVLSEILPLQVGTKARLSSTQARRLQTDIGHQRARTRQNLRATVGSAAFQECVGKTDDALASPSLLRNDVPARTAPWIRRIRRSFAKLDRRARRAGKGDLHRIRLRAKRCRYALEALGEAAPQGSLQQLKRLQTSLGRYCDARLAVAWLERSGTLRDEKLRKLLLREARAMEKRRARTALRKLHRGFADRPYS